MEGKKRVDQLIILRALAEIPFGVGKNLLIDFLQGNEKNKSIERNNLNKKDSFGSMIYEKEELIDLIDNLSLNGFIKQTTVNGNRFWKVFELSSRGEKELKKPEDAQIQTPLKSKFEQIKTQITDQDKNLFEAFGSILKKFNDEQKKAIISNNFHLLCIAGAGSGKTTVLTKRIEFLTKYRSINPARILAITFTRKARKEMIARLERIGSLDLVQIETFNSFCEKILKRNSSLIYNRDVRVISYRDKILIVNRALSTLGLSKRQAINAYFTSAQRRGKTDDQLSNIFLNDCFFIRDYFKFKHRPITKDAFNEIDEEHKWSAKIVLGVCNFIESYMKKQGLRDFADQLIDTISFFEKHKNMIPEFDHVLIDEYQDVNSTQIKLIDLLNPKNLFCVGDPRQSIYGWRGSDIKYITNFKDKYPDCEQIFLTKNYRSTKPIVDLINKSIKNMGLADLESASPLASHSKVSEKNKNIHLLKFKNRDEEFSYVINEIKKSDVFRHEIFVLARTNRLLTKMSMLMKRRGVRHVVRSDELRRSVKSGLGEVTLATVHAIKGLEAEMVFVVGATGINFPCRGSEHPVVDMVTLDEYDKQEEERRLFYVAMSRARTNLYITYSGKKATPFINKDMTILLNPKDLRITKEDLVANKKLNSKTNKNNKVIDKLKQWRKTVSFSENRPAFMILHDKTILDIANKLPKTTKDLLSVNGLGPMKIHKFGNDILDIVNSFA